MQCFDNMEEMWKTIPRCIIQYWVIVKMKYGYYALIAERISNQTKQRVTRDSIVNAIRFISEEPTFQSEKILLESVQFIKEQGNVIPDYVEKYLNESSLVRED